MISLNDLIPIPNPIHIMNTAVYLTVDSDKTKQTTVARTHGVGDADRRLQSSMIKPFARKSATATIKGMIAGSSEKLLSRCRPLIASAI